MREFDKVQATAKAMQRHGGGFVQALGAALMRADPDNRERIHAAFPEYWEQYRSMAETSDWYIHEWRAGGKVETQVVEEAGE